MKSYFAVLIFVFLLVVPLYPHVSVAQDVNSKAVTVGPGVERRWTDLPKTMNVQQEESKSSIRYEIDLPILQALKNQPFKLADNLPSTEVDEAVSLSEPQPLAPPILRDFEGLDDLNQPDGYLHRPPDPILAVGFNHVGVMVNSEFAFYTKDGTLVVETDFSSWWSDVYSGTAIPFDPRIAYDHHADRWLMMALVKDYPDSWYLLSVSQTSDPTGAWWNYKLDGTLWYGGATWADYPDLGFDGIMDGAIYITSNQFTFAADRFRTAMLNILPKSALYSGTGFSYWRAWDRKNEDGSKVFTLRAAHTFGDPGGEFLINSKSGGWNKVTLWRVNPTFPDDPVDWVRQATITIGGYSPPPDAQQLGGSATLDTIDNRIYNCMYRNGYLYAAFTEAYDWGSGTVAAIRYLKIDTSANSTDLDVRYGADGYYYWFPAIYTDGLDNIVIVFARSSPTEYAGIRYTGHRSTDPLPQPSALLKAGETYITGDRWGDYFGIGNDPSRGSKVWIYGEWAKDCPGVSSVWDWGTWVGEVSFAPTTIIVPDDYPTIQEAVNNAIEGDTIYVRADTYYENIVVNKTVTLIGENKENTIVDGDGIGSVVNITASNVSFSGFTLQNMGTVYPDAGIYIRYSNNNWVSNNILAGNGLSVRSDIGIRLDYSHFNVISENYAYETNRGISTWGSHNNTISRNSLYMNYAAGIHLDASANNSVTYNTVLHSRRESGSGTAIRVWSNNNVVTGNNFSQSDYGLWFDGSNNTATCNILQNNDVGIHNQHWAVNVFYHNNVIDNIQQTEYGELCTWDGGYPSGGNYWSDYNGTDFYSGPYQNITGSDGIGDTPYVIDANNQDNYPLMNPYIAGDVDYDGIVNASDLSDLGKAYGAVPDSPNWNARADINDDLIVNIIDLFTLGKNFGKTGP